MRDLEIRGAGNLLGEDQSGHIAAVGYDLYCQMVTEAVAEMKGEELREPAEVKLDVPVDAHLPLDYVTKEELRLEAYRRLAAVTDHARGRRHPRRVGGPLRPGARAGRPTCSPSASCGRECLRARPPRRVHHLRPGPPGAHRAADERDDAAPPGRPRRHLQGAAGQLVLPLRRGEDPAARLVALLTELVPEPERAASA